MAFARAEIQGREAFSAMGMQDGPHKILEEADAVLSPRENRLLWVHHNTKSTYPLTMELQGLESLIPKYPDPLAGRTFGGCVSGAGLVAKDRMTLVSKEPHETWAIDAVFPPPQSSIDEWVDSAMKVAKAASSDSDAPPESKDALEKHVFENPYNQTMLGWRHLWDRSWIHVSGPGAEPTGVKPTNRPLRIGADSNGEHRFVGKIRRISLWNRALPRDEVRGSSLGAFPTRGLIGSWQMRPNENGEIPNGSPSGSLDRFRARVVGKLAFASDDKGSYAQLSGDGYLEIAPAPELDLQSFTIYAEVNPESLPPAGVRILDKTIAGTDAGYLLDTYPGGSIRSIVAAGTLVHDAKLEAESLGSHRIEVRCLRGRPGALRKWRPARVDAARALLLRIPRIRAPALPQRLRRARRVPNQIQRLALHR